MSLAGSRFSSESAPRPFHHGVRGRGGTFGRPCRQTDGRSGGHCDLTSSIVPRGTSCHRTVELAFLLRQSKGANGPQTDGYQWDLTAEKQFLPSSGKAVISARQRTLPGSVFSPPQSYGIPLIATYAEVVLATWKRYCPGGKSAV